MLRVSSFLVTAGAESEVHANVSVRPWWKTGSRAAVMTSVDRKRLALALAGASPLRSDTSARTGKARTNKQVATVSQL